MAQKATLPVQRRAGTGKGAARSLRRQGKIPAVIYGHNRPPEALEVDAVGFTRLLAGISAASTIIDVTVDGAAPVKVLIREIQRDILRAGEVVHVDLFEVRADEKVTLEVPVHLVGTADGVRNHGGVLDQVMHRLQIKVFPGDIPERVEIDVTDVIIGHSIFVRDVTIPKAEILNDPALPVCSVVAPRAEEAPPAAGVVAETPAEPELIRKPKAEGEDEGEAEKE
jgi:large subunit ribosomal protein L25